MKNRSKITLSASLALLLLAAWMGWEMIRRGQEQLLWGYRPLVFFVAIWGAIVLFRAWWIARKRAYNWRHLFLSTLSGILLAVGFPDIVPLPFLMFIAFVPILIVEDEISRTNDGTRGKVFRHAYQAFVVWNILATYWVGNTSFIAGVVAIWANALLMCIPFMLFHSVRNILPRLRYFAFIAFWITWEYFHLNWELTWPWLTLGNSFAEVPSWIQWYEYTGVFGGSLWILGANSIAFKIWQQYQAEKKLPLKGVIRFSALIVLPIIASLVIYWTYEEKGTAVEVVVVQPNYEPHYEKFAVPEADQVRRFLRLTEEKLDDDTEYVVYPETSFGYVETSRLNDYPAIRTIRRLISSYPELKVVTGINAFHDFEEGEPHSKAVRERRGREGETIYYEVLNAAIQITGGEEQIPVYKKSKLVPGPEIFPFHDILFFMEPLVESLDGTTAGVGTQEERSVFSSSSGKVAPAICYESVFGEYATGYIRNGAEAIFVMTNDGWWDNTAGHRQHLHFASLRAIETRRPVARSANTGISGFINQRGNVLETLPYGVEGSIKGKMVFNKEMTFYVLWGDMIARLAMFLSVIILLNGIVKTRITKPQS